MPRACTGACFDLRQPRLGAKALLEQETQPAHLQAAALRTSQPADCMFLGTSTISFVARREADCQMGPGAADSLMNSTSWAVSTWLALMNSASTKRCKTLSDSGA